MEAVNCCELTEMGHGITGTSVSLERHTLPINLTIVHQVPDGLEQARHHA